MVYLEEIKLDSGVKYDPVSRNLYLKEPMVQDVKFQEESLLQKLPDGIKKVIGDHSGKDRGREADI